MINAQNQISNDFDIDNLEALSRAVHTVGVRFDAEGNAISGFHIVGKNSPEYLANQVKMRGEAMQRSAKRKEKVDAATEQGADLVVDILRKNERSTALAVVTGWFGWNKAGQPLDFDKSILEQMFDKMPTWQDKVLEDLDEDGNFTKV